MEDMRIKNIIFDWSGTLSDDLTPVYETVNIIFKQLGREPISLEEYKEEVAMPYMVFWNKYFPNLTKKEQDKLWPETFLKTGDPQIYKGVKKTLEKLKKLKIKMTTLSSHPILELQKEAKHYGIFKLFQETNGSIHNKTKEITRILIRNKFKKEQTMLVADMADDIIAGKTTGLKTIAVTWGYQSKKKLKTSNPDHIIDHISELPKLL